MSSFKPYITRVAFGNESNWSLDFFGIRKQALRRILVPANARSGRSHNARFFPANGLTRVTKIISMVDRNISDYTDVTINNVDRVESSSQSNLKYCKVDFGLSKDD